MFSSLPRSDATLQAVMDPRVTAYMKRRARRARVAPHIYYPITSGRPDGLTEFPTQFRLDANRYVDYFPVGGAGNKFHSSHRLSLYYIQEDPQPFNMNGRGRSASQNVEYANVRPPVRNRRFEMFSKLRTLIAFWILGLCNNYGYAIILSAAYDMLSDRFNTSEVINAEIPVTTMVANDTIECRDCNQLSIGSILLADILPGLFIKCISWFFPLAINVRMVLVAFLSAAGFVLVGSSKHLWVVILGVVLTAISSGLGEASVLPYMAFFDDRKVISSWSSGTGAAGFLGALSYLVLIYYGFSMEWTFYILTIIPLIMIASFWFLMKHPTVNPPESFVTLQIVGGEVQYNLNNLQQENNGDRLRNTTNDTILQKIKYIPKLMPYMLPIGLVYFFEYFINQALYDLMYFQQNEFVPDHYQQYRMYHLTYQMSVLISRSSYAFMKVENIKTFAIAQGVIAIIFLVGAIYSAFPGFSSVLLIIAFEGLIGGSAYVNTFQKITVEVDRNKREFALAISSLADAVGITLAGIIAIPVHNYICALPMYNGFFNFMK